MSNTVYFVLYLLAFICFVGAAFSSRVPARINTALVPVGLALVTLVWLLQQLARV